MECYDNRNDLLGRNNYNGILRWPPGGIQRNERQGELSQTIVKRKKRRMNNCTLIGRLGKDAESKQHGERYRITFSMATSEKRKDGERTDWHNVTYWSKSNVIVLYLKQGAQLAVSGAYRNDKGQDGKYWYYLDANRIELIGGKKEETEQDPF